MKWAYNSTYSPPIPILPVYFSYSATALRLGPLDAIVDTGADTTIVPEIIALKLQAAPLNVGRLKTQWGDTHAIVFYLLDLEIGTQVFPANIVAGDSDSDEIILGRDVLNKLALLLDGPQQAIKIPGDIILKRLRV